ncbi:MAG: Flagellar basal-body rod protein FlgC [uncultured Phycisphaerae bacterium]|uniref:Flagellar basal-body rod protein FlgC n=1 Tax=uncultured Phycisphaerae bacterium TaxID=904963 RepID=A0A6J4P843_9BACT|nr:MAG: Flagellar basal-body rod protein FlgC [uncultured Phycisphaerae bacterium]
MFDILDIGASGLQAQRTRLDTIAANIANVNTTRDAAGRPNPYRRRFVVLEPSRAGNAQAPGVRVREIKLDPSPFNRRLQPGHEDADAQGYVNYPNIDTAIEYVNALEASRAYEANISLLETSKAMINSTLRLIA